MLSFLGRFDDAFVEIGKAQDLDPLSLIIGSIHGAILYRARKYDEAIEQLKKVLEMDPDFIAGHELLYFSYVMKGMLDEAMAHNVARRRVRGWTTEELEALERAYATDGVEGLLRKQLEISERRSKREYFPAMEIAEVCLCMGEKDLAFEWLEMALEERSSRLVHLKVDPRWDPLRSDPRFYAALRKLGFEN